MLPEKYQHCQQGLSHVNTRLQGCRGPASHSSHWSPVCDYKGNRLWYSSAGRPSRSLHGCLFPMGSWGSIRYVFGEVQDRCWHDYLSYTDYSIASPYPLQTFFCAMFIIFLFSFTSFTSFLFKFSCLILLFPSLSRWLWLSPVREASSSHCSVHFLSHNTSTRLEMRVT